MYGAELSFVSQNLKDKYYEYDKDKISRRFMDFVLILTTKIIISRFEENMPPVSAEYIANKSNLPIRLINDSVKILLSLNIIVEIIDDNNNHTYMPAFDINKISVATILDRVEKSGKENYGIKGDGNYNTMWEMIKEIKDKISADSKDLLIKDI